MKPEFSIVPRKLVAVEDRKSIPRSWKDKALEKSGGLCSYPGCQEKGRLEFDHVLPIKLGGAHSVDNIEPLCKSHHLAKTKLDVKMIARSKRMRGERGQQERRAAGKTKPIPSKPFPKGQTSWPKRSFPKRGE